MTIPSHVYNGRGYGSSRHQYRICSRTRMDMLASRRTSMDRTNRTEEGGAMDGNSFSLPPGHSRKMNLGRDPVSHRVIEKRRRDRMNQCLNQLSGLLPTSYKEKRCGRVEKTEIVELAIHYIKYLISTASSERSFAASGTSAQASFAQGYSQCAAHVLHIIFSLKDVDSSCASDEFIAQLRCHLENICTELGPGKTSEQSASHLSRHQQRTDITSEIALSCWDRDANQSQSAGSSSSSSGDRSESQSDNAGYKFKDHMRKRFTSAPVVSGSSTPIEECSTEPEIETEKNVPCFALLADRDSYTPLSVPSRILERYATSGNGNMTMSSHPVSIMVDYGDMQKGASRGQESSHSAALSS